MSIRYIPGLPEVGGGETIDVTAPDPGIPYGFDLGAGGPGSYDPSDFVDVGDPGAIDLRTNKEGEGAVFGDKAEAGRREKLKKALKLLGTVPGMSTQFLELLMGALGITDFGNIDGLDALQRQGTAANLLGVPTIPTPQPGATRGVSFLDWQPDNPYNQPSRMVHHQLYQPQSVGVPPGLLQALADKLAAEIGIGAGGSGAAPQTPGLGSNRSYKLTPRIRLGGGGSRSGGGTQAF